MAIHLNKKELDHIKNYKYDTSPATPLDGVFDPWWNWVVSVTPEVSTILLLIFINSGYRQIC
jgi:hypothetical protein